MNLHLLARKYVMPMLAISASFSTSSLAATQADQNTALAALRDYNVVTFGNLTTNNHIDGRIFVGGDLTATGAVLDMKNPANPNGTPALTVGGNASFVNSPSVNGPNVRVGGSINGTFNSNGGGTVVTGGATAIAQQRDTLRSALTAYSSHLSGLDDTQQNAATYDGQVLRISAPLTFNVINISGNLLSSVNDRLQFTSLGGTTIINVSGTSISFTRNFQNNMSSYGSNILWNFFEAETITLGDFGGSILAVNADLTKNGNGGINGSVIVDNILGQSAEIRNNSFAGSNIAPIPEMATWMMLIAGLGAVGTTMRSRRRVALRVAKA
ncbi:choice-of-anchor A family protein [Sphingomonas crocodyli]|uniref:Choice-of-anchor A family protein n=1 Tax=Sphingomonas crocodyli TaxID=1979270 RepID=A0A437LXS6_9SPHN|nr:choice-of-anchor A family protein [Sphingomonas crocodyli]RVT90215.1 choice-of-anchor A family protein [Sphingomonas crocodyli]